MNEHMWIRRIKYALIRLRLNIQGRLPHPHVSKGDKFVAAKSLPARGLVQWRAPFTSGFECVIPEGTVLVAENDSAPISTGFGCIPENQKELETQLVPEQDRMAEKYAGYYFVLSYKHIGKELKPCQ